MSATSQNILTLVMGSGEEEEETGVKRLEDGDIDDVGPMFSGAGDSGISQPSSCQCPAQCNLHRQVTDDEPEGENDDDDDNSGDSVPSDDNERSENDILCIIKEWQDRPSKLKNSEVVLLLCIFVVIGFQIEYQLGLMKESRLRTGCDQQCNLTSQSTATCPKSEASCWKSNYEALISEYEQKMKRMKTMEDELKASEEDSAALEACLNVEINAHANTMEKKEKLLKEHSALMVKFTQIRFGNSNLPPSCSAGKQLGKNSTDSGTYNSTTKDSKDMNHDSSVEGLTPDVQQKENNEHTMEKLHDKENNNSDQICPTVFTCVITYLMQLVKPPQWVKTLQGMS